MADKFDTMSFPTQKPDYNPPPATLFASQPRPQRTWPAVLTLFFLAGLIPETIATYNNPPLLLIIKPFNLLFISVFYGSIALLVRELIHRRKLRWASILLLGIAAGSINEGIIAGTWYRVEGTPGYAMIDGVNPTVAIGLTVFHTLFSTILPILLVELIFPRVATRSWVGKKGMLAFLLLLLLTTLTGFAPLADRNLKAVVLLGVIALVVTALALPQARPSQISLKRVPGLGKLRWMGILGTLLFFLIFAIIPGMIGYGVAPGKLPSWQILPVTLMSSLFCLAITLGHSWSTRAGWGQRQTLAVITGALLPAIFVSLWFPFALKTLEPLATVPMLLLLIWLARRTKRLEEAATPNELPSKRPLKNGER